MLLRGHLGLLMGGIFLGQEARPAASQPHPPRQSSAIKVSPANNMAALARLTTKHSEKLTHYPWKEHPEAFSKLILEWDFRGD